MSDTQMGLSPADAAKLLGMKRRTFYNLVMPHVYDKTIASAKIGRLRLIDADSLRAWWQSQLQ